MALERDLARWVDAGLIDNATADRIRDHERSGSRPVWQWAVAAIGVLSVGLGILLLVAANWDEVPGWAKLAIHLLLTAIAAGAVALAAGREKRWLGEAALFLFACLLLAGLALHAQIYQLAGPSWKLLLAGLLLAGPALLLHGRTALAGAALGLLTLFAAAAYVFTAPELGIGVEGQRLLPGSLALAAPLLLLALGVMPGDIPQPGMARILRAAPLWLLGLGAFVMAPVVWHMEIDAADALKALRLFVVSFAVAALVLWLNHRSARMPRQLLAALLLASLAVPVAPLLIPHPPDALWAQLLGLLLTLAGLGWIALAAGEAGWRWLFNLAVALAGLRIFIVYFELFGSLATTGFGMVGGGLLLIALAWGWRRVTRIAKPAP